jgi:hypothetical protein
MEIIQQELKFKRNESLNYIQTLRFVVYDSYSNVRNRISTRKVVAFQISP